MNEPNDKHKSNVVTHVPEPSEDIPSLTIDDLGWTTEDAARIRAQLAAFAEDWDDPTMDVYDDV